MNKDNFHIRNTFYQIFTRYLLHYNQYLEIDFYHFTHRSRKVLRYIFKILSVFEQKIEFLNIGIFRCKFGKMVKNSESIANGSGNYLVKIFEKNLNRQVRA